MRRPFVFIVLALLLGIIGYIFVEVNLYLALILLALFIFLNIFLLFRDFSMELSLFGLFFFLGLALTGLRATSSDLVDFLDQALVIEASIEEVKSTIDGEARYIARVHRLEGKDESREISEKMLLKVIGEKQLGLGDEVRCNLTLRQAKVNSNPGLFNYRAMLLSDNIHTIATIKDYSIESIVETELEGFEALKLAFVDRVASSFDSFLKEDNSSLMKAVILGENSYLGEENIEDFRDLGLSHILAVSGLHIGIITGVLVGFMAVLGINRKVNVGITLAIIWLYAYLIGGPASVIRANIMFSILLIAESFGHAHDSINTLAFALFLMLLINPFWILSLGFQLSFMATFSIIYLTPKVKAYFYPHSGSLVSTISSLLAIQIGLLPVQAYYFNRISFVSILANLILVPIFTIGLVLSMVLLVFSSISFHISTGLGIAINLLLGLQFKAVEILHSLPYLQVKVASPSILGIFLYLALLYLIFNPRILRNLNSSLVKSLVVYLCLILLVNSIATSLDRSLEVHFIDVGQGDCALVRSGSGDYLFDTGGVSFGSFDVGKSIVLPYLEKLGIFKLDGVFISHYHDDHCQSLPYLMDNMEVGSIFVGYKNEASELYKSIASEARDKNIPLYLIEKGQEIRLGRNTGLVALGPGRSILEGSRDNENDLSLVLLLKHEDQSLLFTGDIEEKAERALASEFKLPIDFLKVAHHGSKTSSTQEFLDAFTPSTAFMSLGENNSFGHPNREVIERYEERYIDVYRTDEAGRIRLVLNDGFYSIDAFVKEKNTLKSLLGNYSLEISLGMLYFLISYIMVRYLEILEGELREIEL